MEKSANVFLTKSFWLPVGTMLSSKVALTVQDFVTFSETEQTAIAGVLTTLAIALVRRFTARPAHFTKPKIDQPMKEDTP